MSVVFSQLILLVRIVLLSGCDLVLPQLATCFHVFHTNNSNLPYQTAILYKKSGNDRIQRLATYNNLDKPSLKASLTKEAKRDPDEEPDPVPPVYKGILFPNQQPKEVETQVRSFALSC
jgi:hypothetical protein